MHVCKECGERTRTSYIRKTKSGVATWIPIGEFCPLCHSVYISYNGNEIEELATAFIEKMVAYPHAIFVVEYMKENHPETLDTIIDTIPELKSTIKTQHDKDKIIDLLQSLYLIKDTVYAANGRLAPSIMLEKIIDHMNAKHKPTEEEPDQS